MDMVAGVKTILLEVAEEIEKDDEYNGQKYWDYKTNKGCVITRVLSRLTYVGRDKDQVFLGNIEYLGIEGELRTTREGLVHGYLEKVTGIDELQWEILSVRTAFKDRFKTAEMLRKLADGKALEEIKSEG